MTYTYVDGVGEFPTSVGDLATNVQELRGRLTSVSNDAYTRIVTAGKQDVGKTEGTRVSMIINYLKGEKPVLLKQERFPIGLARKLIEANSKKRYYSTNSEKAYETAIKTAEQENKQGIEPKKRTAIICPSRIDFSMSPDENKSHYEFVFGDMAYENKENRGLSYFQLNKGPITFCPIDVGTVDSINGAIQNYLWFRSLDNGSVLIGSYRNANYCIGRARGALKRTHEAGRKNFR